MGVFKSTKKLATKIVDVRVDKWLGVDYLKETTGHYKALLMDLIVPQKARYSETFDEAVQRLELSDEALHARAHEFTKLFYFFIVLSMLVISYGLYLAYRGSFASALIAFCLSLYSLTQAFRFHFWLFQLKNRKLGCTLKEWFNSSAMSVPSKEIIKKETDNITPHDDQHNKG